MRGDLAYPLSFRDVEEMMAERGVPVDHSTSYRWVQKLIPRLEITFRDRVQQLMPAGC